MSNPLFNLLGGGQNMMMNPLMQRFQQFRKMFRGDPNQQIQQIMNSGRVNQNQYNQAVQMAQQFSRMFGGR